MAVLGVDPGPTVCAVCCASIFAVSRLPRLPEELATAESSNVGSKIAFGHPPTKRQQVLGKE
jgi:hypothetical protein